MIELTDFLLARIADDEAVARAVPPLDEWEDPAYYSERLTSVESDNSYEDAVFVNRFNPTRVLAECEAKRRIVQSCTIIGAGIPSPRMDEAAWLEHFVLLPLVQPYANHPDFRKEWLV